MLLLSWRGECGGISIRLMADRTFGNLTGTAKPSGSERIAAFDYLRSFGVLLVLFHHTILGYVTWGFLNPQNPTSTFTPIVDGMKWAGFDVIVGLNDTFFMPLLFLISGLFVWRDLEGKGTARYLRGRLTRLGIPFLAGVVVLIPLAYYPTILEIELVYGWSRSFGEFWIDIARLGFAPSGPLWFVWLLLVFDCLAALVYPVFRKAGDKSKRRFTSFLDNSLLFALTLIGLALAAYLPMRTVFSPGLWLGIGPFRLEIVRLFLYLVYFAAGVFVGARGLKRGLFSADGPFARRWWIWMVAGLLSYAGLAFFFTTAPQSPLVSLMFIIEMALMVVGLASLFVRFARRHVPILDSLSANSYGIYIIHYLVVIWLQYAVLRIDLPAVVKGVLVFVGGLAICWGFVAAMRRIRAVARIV